MSLQDPGRTAITEKGWLRAHKWLLLRRVSQLGFLLLFLLGPWFGIWIVTGNLTSSMTLDVLPLTDPYILLQSVLTGHVPDMLALIGAAIVVVLYALLSGRMYCAWVCPINIVSDSAAWLRRRLNLSGGAHFSRQLRFWILAMTLVLAVLTGMLAWELINPVTMVHRGLVFGMGLAWFMLLAIFLLDVFVSHDAWCGHLCPMGAFYNLLGRKGIVRIRAVQREQCDDCMDCYGVCPEVQVIKPALKGAARGIGPVILDASCTNCGRCIDVCAKQVFKFSTRFNNFTART